MKIRILKECKDKVTGEAFEIGKEYDLGAERNADAVDRGSAEYVEEKKVVKPKTEKK